MNSIAHFISRYRNPLDIGDHPYFPWRQDMLRVRAEQAFAVVHKGLKIAGVVAVALLHVVAFICHQHEASSRRRARHH